MNKDGLATIAVTESKAAAAGLEDTFSPHALLSIPHAGHAHSGGAASPDASNAEFPFDTDTVQLVTATEARHRIAKVIIPRFPTIKHAFLHADTYTEGAIRYAGREARSRGVVLPFA